MPDADLRPALVKTLPEVHQILARGFLQLLPWAAPVRSGSAAWQASVARTIAECLEKEQELADELVRLAAARHVLLSPSTFAPAYGRFAYMTLEVAARRATELAEHENRRLQIARKTLAADADLAALLSRILSARRNHARQLKRLANQAARQAAQPSPTARPRTLEET